MIGLLLAMLFMPHQVVTVYPKPDPVCFYDWMSDPMMLENRCDAPLVIEIAYKNGQGTHTILKKGETMRMRELPVRGFVCTAGKGEPSAAEDRMVHPSFKSKGYVCLEQHLEFSPYAGGL